MAARASALPFKMDCDRESSAERALAHSNKGLKGLLAIPWAYRLFSRALGGASALTRLVAHHIRPFDGCRILDLGCGPGGLPAYLGGSIGEYHGVDANPAYIDAARARWKDRPIYTFVCEEIASTVAPRRSHYDIVTAVAVVHHLDDAEARHLFSLAHEALAPGGRLITWDGVYVERQNRVARWLISKDRGRAVRTSAGYKRLAAEWFDTIDVAILHDTLRVPYTICAMTCTKSRAAIQ
jgi:SAM-dependent methyltransferase